MFNPTPTHFQTVPKADKRDVRPAHHELADRPLLLLPLLARKHTPHYTNNAHAHNCKHHNTNNTAQ